MTNQESYWNNQSDVYQYPDSTVLQNIPGIKNEDELSAFEKLAVAERLEEAHQFSVNKIINFDLWKKIHQIIFQDIFTWAGQLRTVQMSKGNTLFAHPEHIEKEGNRLFSDFNKENDLKNLDKTKLCIRLAYYFSELNALDPFRDGNGRTQRLLFEVVISRLGYEVSWKTVTPTEYLQAVIEGYNHKFSKLEVAFKKILTKI